MFQGTSNRTRRTCLMKTIKAGKSHDTVSLNALFIKPLIPCFFNVGSSGTPAVTCVCSSKLPPILVKITGSLTSATWRLCYTKGCQHENIEIGFCYNWLQRPYRKDRLPRDSYCCRQLAKFRFVGGICLLDTQVWLVCWANVFLVAGCGILQIWIQNKKFEGMKLGPMRQVSIHEEEEKVQNKNLHNYSKISTP